MTSTINNTSIKHLIETKSKLQQSLKQSEIETKS